MGHNLLERSDVNAAQHASRAEGGGRRRERDDAIPPFPRPHQLIRSLAPPPKPPPPPKTKEKSQEDTSHTVPFVSLLTVLSPFFCACGEGKKKCVGGQGAGGGRQMIFSPMLILFFRGGCFAIKTRGRRRRRRAKHSRTTVLQL